MPRNKVTKHIIVKSIKTMLFLAQMIISIEYLHYRNRCYGNGHYDKVTDMKSFN